MPKYYVKSGSLEVIISRKDALEASIGCLLMANKFDTIDEYFYADERGYRDYLTANNETNVISTKSIIKAAGWELTRDDDPLP